MNYQTEFAAFMNGCADEAHAIALKYFRQPLAVDSKPDCSPVTQADLDIEKAFRARVSQSFPSHGVIGEEDMDKNAGAEFVWVIDPVDGTKSFAVGRPLFGTVIALMHHGDVVAGLIEQAFTNERWCAFSGAGSRFNDTPVKVAPGRRLSQARSFFSSPAIFHDDCRTQIMALSAQTLWPHFGCDCYAYGLLAMGCADLVIEQDLKWHDIAGVLPIIIEAGGHVQDWSGRPVTPHWDGTLIAASSKDLAIEAAQTLKKFPR